MDRLISPRALFSRIGIHLVALSLALATATATYADQQPAAGEQTEGGKPESETEEKKSPPFADPPLPGLKRLAPNANVWIDLPNKQLVLGGEIVLRRGPLELFACLKNTKEHEAIVSVETKAYIVHAGLLACGAVVGNPASFQPEYVPARGTEIEVLVEWTDAAGKKQKIDARQMIKNAKSGKPMESPWVFGGSGFWTDPADNTRHYKAEDGDLICISNFPTAMLDVPVESSNANSALLFEALSDAIPPEKTKVLLYLKPKLDKKPADGDKPAAKKPSGDVGATTPAATTSVVAAPIAQAVPVKAATVAKTEAEPVVAAATPSPAAPEAPALTAATPAESGSAPAPSPASTHSSRKTDQTPRIGRWLRRNASYKRSL